MSALNDPSDEELRASDIEALSPAEVIADDLERLRLLAFVSGSIAHDLNNLLMAIENTAAVLMEQGGESVREQADLILKSARAAAKLAQQLQHAGRRRAPQLQACDLNELVGNSLDIVRAVTGQWIQVQFRPEPDLAEIFVDPHQIQEVLLNLAVNGREAMPAGGTLTLATQSEIVSAEEVDLSPGSYARLSVCDTGVGMDEATKLRVFEPYFTTRQIQGNSGLGLATVREALRQSGGEIRLSSAPGRGTCFDLYLPFVLGTHAEPASEGRFLLLLEDSDELRRMIEEFLVAQGYQVIACSSAEELLLRIESSPLAPEVIIADVFMPRTLGTDFVARIRDKYPQLTPIFISGHAGTDEGMPVLPEDALFLQKPFSLQALAAALEQVWASRPASQGTREIV